MPSTSITTYLRPLPDDRPDKEALKLSDPVAGGSASLAADPEEDRDGAESYRPPKAIDEAVEQAHLLLAKRLASDLAEDKPTGGPIRDDLDDTSFAEDEENILTEVEKAELANAVIPDTMFEVKREIAEEFGEPIVAHSNDRAGAEAENASKEQEQAMEPFKNWADRQNSTENSIQISRYCGYFFILLLTCAVIALGIFAAIAFDQNDSTMPLPAPVQSLEPSPISTSSPTDSTWVTGEPSLAPTPTFENASPILLPTVMEELPASPVFVAASARPTQSTSDFSPTLDPGQSTVTPIATDNRL